jgi:hypothetical protein
MFYDFGLGGVGQYNAPGLAMAPAPTPYAPPPPPQFMPPQIPPSSARPPAIPSAVNPYESAQTRLLKEQQDLVNQYSQIPQPQLQYKSPMNPLAAALIAFGTGTLAAGGDSAQAIGTGGKAGLETYLGLKNADQEGMNKTSQANYANQVNRLKAVMGGLGELSTGYAGLSKDQAERAKAAAMVGADVYGTQVKEDNNRAQNAMELAKLEPYTNLLNSQAGYYRFNSDPNNPVSRAATAAATAEERNAIARQKMEGEYGEQVRATVARAGTMSDRQLELAVNELLQISPAAKAAASSMDPKENLQYIRQDIYNTLRLARDEALGVVTPDPKENKPKESKGLFGWLFGGEPSENPMKTTGLKVPGSNPIKTYP